MLKIILKRLKYSIQKLSSAGCGHCKIFKPKYEEAADKLKELKSKTRLASIEGSEGRSFAKQFKVYGFPTLVHLM